LKCPGVSFQHQNHQDFNTRYCVSDIFVLDYGYIIDSEQSKQSGLISEESVKTMSGSNIAEKILAAHIGRKKVSPGEFLNVKVDFVLANDITAPIAIKEFGRELGVVYFEVWCGGEHCRYN